jgi:hypothetical protein
LCVVTKIANDPEKIEFFAFEPRNILRRDGREETVISTKVSRLTESRVNKVDVDLEPIWEFPRVDDGGGPAGVVEILLEGPCGFMLQ